MRYFVSAGMFTQDGMFKQLAASDNFNFNYKRYNYRANLDFDATKTTLISVILVGVLKLNVLLSLEKTRISCSVNYIGLCLLLVQAL